MEATRKIVDLRMPASSGASVSWLSTSKKYHHKSGMMSMLRKGSTTFYVKMKKLLNLPSIVPYCSAFSTLTKKFSTSISYGYGIPIIQMCHDVTCQKFLNFLQNSGFFTKGKNDYTLNGEFPFKSRESANVVLQVP